MSKIASKPNTELNANMSQPTAKKGSGAEPALLFDGLFGGVLATGAIVDSMDTGSTFTTAKIDFESDLDEHTDILASMQSVAAMMAAHRSQRHKSEFSHTVRLRLPMIPMLVPKNLRAQIQ